MNSSAFTFIVAYFLVYLGGAKLLTHLSVGEPLSFWPAFTAAAFLSLAFAKSIHTLWLAPTLYFFFFALDYFAGWQLIVSAQAESLITGLFATVIFTLPLLLGWGLRTMGKQIWAAKYGSSS